jgi:hypothetical protein
MQPGVVKAMVFTEKSDLNKQFISFPIMSENSKKKNTQKSGENQQSTNKALQERAAQALLENGAKFKISGLGSFTIKPLTAYVLISISKDALKVDSIGEKPTVYSVIAHAEYAKPMARIAAKAILHSPLKIKLFGGVLSWLLLRKLTHKSLFELMNTSINLSSADFFFSSINLISQIRTMEPDTQETKASGEQ